MLNNPIVNSNIGFIIHRNEVEMIKLRELREGYGYTVREMCAKLGVDDSRYRKWEAGTNNLPLDYSLMCCEIFHCTLDELAGRVPLSFSSDERKLLDLFRSCNAQGRELMIALAATTAAMFAVES